MFWILIHTMYAQPYHTTAAYEFEGHFCTLYVAVVQSLVGPKRCKTNAGYIYCRAIILVVKASKSQRSLERGVLLFEYDIYKLLCVSM